MYSVDDISEFTYPFNFICADCDKSFTIENIGVSVSGKIGVFLKCGHCGQKGANFYDYDYFLIESQKALVVHFQEH